MANVIKICFLFSFVGAVVCPGVGGPGAGPDNTRMCRVCDSVKDPTQCMHMEKCHGFCATEVWHEFGQEYFTLGCFDEHECHHLNHHHGLMCRECCNDFSCQIGLCTAFLPTTTPLPTPAPTTPIPTTPIPKTSTQAPTTTTVPAAPANLCRNIETSGFQCSDMDKYNFCTDTTSLAHMIAFEKCPLHCGLCRYGQAMPTYPPTLPPATATSQKTTTAPLVTNATVVPSGKRSKMSFRALKQKLN